MGQLERALNRIYGIERDRPTIRKYGRALVLAISAGLLSVAAFAALAAGRSIALSLTSDRSIHVWNVIRWPVGLVLALSATALLFRWSPRRRQPAWSWLAFGAFVAVVLWTLAMCVWLYATRIPALKKHNVTFDPHRPADDRPGHRRRMADSLHRIVRRVRARALPGGP